MKKTRSRDLLYSRHLATSTLLAVIAAALLFSGCTTRQHQETLTEEPERPGAAQTTIPLPTMQPAYRTGGPLLALKSQELAAPALAKSTSSKIESGEISLPAKPVAEASQPHSPRSDQPVASEEAANPPRNPTPTAEPVSTAAKTLTPTPTPEPVWTATRWGARENGPDYQVPLDELEAQIQHLAANDRYSGKYASYRPAIIEYYKSIGAYGDNDDSPGLTYIPPEPLGGYRCVEEETVANATENWMLVVDCEILMVTRDELRGTAPLNWDYGVSITDWTGVTIAGDPQRVTELNLEGSGLTGIITNALGRMTALTTLNLMNNQLTAMPQTMVQPEDLATIRLSGNPIEGCIAPEIQNIPDNDGDVLGLVYCNPAAPAKPTLDHAREHRIEISWNAVKGAAGYRVYYRSRSDRSTGKRLKETTTFGTSAAFVGLTCGERYSFSVEATGNGTTHKAESSPWSRPAWFETTECVSPMSLITTNPSITVPEDIAPGHKIWTWHFLDPNGDTVTYSLNLQAAGQFSVGESGEIILKEPLDFERNTFHKVTLAASDGVNQTEKTITIHVTDVPD